MCKCEINNLMREKTGASFLNYLSVLQPICLPDPLALLTPI